MLMLPLLSALAPVALALDPSPASPRPTDAQPAERLTRPAPAASPMLDPRALPSGPGDAGLPAPALGAGPVLDVVDTFSTYVLADYSSAPTVLNGANGQTTPVWTVLGALPWVGVATDAVMMNIPAGAPGGVPPASAPPGGEPYLALARRTGQDALTPGLRLAVNYRFPRIRPAAASNGQASISADWHLNDAQTSHGWSAVDNARGVVIDRVFFGGVNLSGILAPFLNANGVLDRFVTLGRAQFDTGLVGALFAPPVNEAVLPLPVGSWFSIMSVMVTDAEGVVGNGVFVKSADSIAAGVLDPRLASGAILPPDGDPLGWVNVFPGIEDDPSTAVIEGIGVALEEFGTPPVTGGALNLGQLTTAPDAGFDILQMSVGFDPPADVAPGFLPDDAFIDNVAVRGVTVCTADLNGDGSVNGADVTTILNDFGMVQQFDQNGIPIPLPADLNGDGVVTGADLTAVLNMFGATGCP